MMTTHEEADALAQRFLGNIEPSPGEMPEEYSERCIAAEKQFRAAHPEWNPPYGLPLEYIRLPERETKQFWLKGIRFKKVAWSKTAINLLFTWHYGRNPVSGHRFLYIGIGPFLGFDFYWPAEREGNS